MPGWLPHLIGSANAEVRLKREALSIVPKSGAAPLAFNVEIAKTPREQALGLMFRTKLSDDEGMLFNYGTPQIITMWMRNTYIPLDMVFIGADGIIIRIEREAQPHSEQIISSESLALAVLEIPGGAAERRGIAVGDRVAHPIFND